LIGAAEPMHLTQSAVDPHPQRHLASIIVVQAFRDELRQSKRAVVCFGKFGCNEFFPGKDAIVVSVRVLEDQPALLSSAGCHLVLGRSPLRTQRRSRKSEREPDHNRCKSCHLNPRLFLPEALAPLSHRLPLGSVTNGTFC